MTDFPDIADFYTPERALAEEVSWCLTGHRRRPLDFILPRIAEYQIKSVVEFGCRSGHVAAGLPEEVRYLGIEQNEWFLLKAQQRCLDMDSKLFARGDIRTRTADQRDPPDLAMAWFFMKHVGLAEWDAVLGKLLACGRYGAFDVQILGKDLDTGEQYHHVYVRPERVLEAIRAAGHEVVSQETFEETTLEGHGPMQVVAYWTRRIEG